MPLFFIEMGQGIIAKGDLRVCTSPLYSCTLIAGFNESTGDGGAYHYPSDYLSDPGVKKDMNTWIDTLRPTAVTLVFAKDPLGTGVMGTPTHDKSAIQKWLGEKCPGIKPQIKEAAGAGMELTDEGKTFNAGVIKDLKGDFEPDDQIRVDSRQAGTYEDLGGITLIGKNREKSTST